MGSPVKKKLFYQTLAFILPFVILSIAATALVLSFTTHRFYRKTILKDYTNILNTAGAGIALYLDSARLDVESLAQVMTSLKLESWEKDIALTAFLHQNPRFTDIDILSAEGGAGASAPSGNPAPTSPHPDLLALVLSGRTAVSNVMTDESGLSHLDIYAPVFRRGKVNEILRGHLGLKFIWDTLEGIRIGKKGQVYVMDGTGEIIAHREIHRTLQPPRALKPEVLKAIRANAGPVEWVDAGDGVFYNLGVYLPGPDWIVALTQPRREVYEYLYKNTWLTAAISLLIIAWAVFWGWRGTRRLLAPIHALHQKVRRIGRGDLEEKIVLDREMDREDEIGDLVLAFNEMTDALKKYVDNEIETVRVMTQTKNLAALGTVASKVSHEMGNFLFGLQMMLAGLKKEPLSQNGQNSLKTIENEMAQTRMFIHAYKDFAKKPILSFTRRSLEGVIREVLDMQKPEAGEKDIALTLNWDPSIPALRMDEGLMHQAFTNLVKNSLEAMDDGPGTLTITGKAAGEHLLVSVADTGPGVDEETHEKLFEPFFSTKGVLGTGLGLPNVKSGIEAHGGTIECVSKPGEGAEFLIRLPLE